MKHLKLLATLLAFALFSWDIKQAAGQEPQQHSSRKQFLPGRDHPNPPEVGTEAPELKLKNLKGKTISLKELSKQNAVVILVLRGWPGYQCPICSRQVGEFFQKIDEFAKHGVQVVMVYPGPAELLEEHALEFQGEQIFPKGFHFLPDPDYVFTNAWGLRWDEEGETAYPSTFIVGKDGKIKYGVTSTSHGGRVSAASVLKELTQLNMDHQ